MSLDDHKVLRIEGVEGTSEGGDLGVSQVSKNAPNKEHFDKLMADESVKTEQVKQDVEAEMKLPNRLEAAADAQNSPRKIQTSELIAQTDNAIEKMEAVKQRLETSNIEPSRALRTSMERNLTHTNENIKIALSKVGVDYAAPEVKTGGLVQPVQKFIGYLTNGQSQLEALSSHLTAISSGGQTISHANMLAIQIKVGLVTQQVEFFASLLNKTLESTKTVMNVQV